MDAARRNVLGYSVRDPRPRLQRVFAASLVQVGGYLLEIAILAAIDGVLEPNARLLVAYGSNIGGICLDNEPYPTLMPAPDDARTLWWVKNFYWHAGKAEYLCADASGAVRRWLCVPLWYPANLSAAAGAAMLLKARRMRVTPLRFDGSRVALPKSPAVDAA